jgi:hypothetical protein
VKPLYSVSYFLAVVLFFLDQTLSKYSKCKPYFSGIGVFGVFFNRRRIVIFEILMMLLSCSGEAPELSINSFKSLTVRIIISPSQIIPNSAASRPSQKLAVKVEENRRIEDTPQMLLKC